MYDATLNTFNKTAYTNINENFLIEYRPVKHLTLNGGLSINTTQSTGDNFKPASHSAFLNMLPLTFSVKEVTSTAPERNTTLRVVWLPTIATCLQVFMV